eukprot:13087982-Alexandrium_andersonii.AAC.1
MSASLVGSEMCIRDSPPGEATGALLSSEQAILKLRTCTHQRRRSGGSAGRSPLQCLSGKVGHLRSPALPPVSAMGPPKEGCHRPGHHHLLHFPVPARGVSHTRPQAAFLRGDCPAASPGASVACRRRQIGSPRKGSGGPGGGVPGQAKESEGSARTI